MVRGQYDRSSTVDRSVPVVVVVVTVKIVRSGTALGVLFFEVKFDGVEPYHNKVRAALVASHSIALFNIGVNKNFFTAFGAN
jgi:hypothetical protein